MIIESIGFIDDVSIMIISCWFFLSARYMFSTHFTQIAFKNFFTASTTLPSSQKIRFGYFPISRNPIRCFGSFLLKAQKPYAHHVESYIYTVITDFQIKLITDDNRWFPLKANFELALKFANKPLLSSMSISILTVMITIFSEYICSHPCRHIVFTSYILTFTVNYLLSIVLSPASLFFGM